mgnify:CR=1 FL=1
MGTRQFFKRAPPFMRRLHKRPAQNRRNGYNAAGAFGPDCHTELIRIKSFRIDLTDRCPFSRPHSKACPGQSLPWSKPALGLPS